MIMVVMSENHAKYVTTVGKFGFSGEVVVHLGLRSN